MKIETDIIPPDIHEEGDDEERQSARIGVHLIEVNEVSYDAGVQFFGDEAVDAAHFAEALLNLSLAIANMRGSDYAWAVMQRFAAYDGMNR